ncbi:tyrosine-type recombinase/integrase [Streptosporangium amethystogenes subsp. fukuiense]|uniref:Tyrosine-type recombinase/integrase n=1 Tax=Streptosporangium amethystogenes subsp. fukuiense TaxID=698418 RepID=A0ABW2SRJ1_9ACTN
MTSEMKDGIRKVLSKRETAAKGRPTYGYKVPYRDANGKQTSETFTNLRDAKAFRDKIRSKKHEGLVFDVKAGRVSFQSYAEQWLGNKEAVKKIGTANQYRSHLTNHAAPFFGGKRMNSVLPSDVQTWVTWLKARQKLAPSTIETVYNIVASLFRTAVRDKVLAESPCIGIELPKKDDRKAVPLTPEQVHAVAETIVSHYRAMAILAAGTGLRQGECFGLTVDRVDFLRKTLTVDRQIVQGGMFDTPKTKASTRTIPLPDTVISALAQHLADYPAEDREVTWADGRKEVVRLIFTSSRGNSLRRNTFNPAWQRATHASGLAEGTGFHALRHTYASLLIARNVSPKVIQARMGHASITETMDTYGHLYPESEEVTRAAIDDALSVDMSTSVDKMMTQEQTA